MMTEKVTTFRKPLLWIPEILKKDMVFTISLVLALGSCALNIPRVEYLDFKVLISLFNLMIIVKAFERINLLDSIAITLLKKCSNSRRVSLVLISSCFIGAMFVTNDVALITFVPLTLIISKKANINVGKMVILETIAANLGSTLTPMGNPQNLFIYSFYNLNILSFMSVVMPLVLFGGLWIYMLNYRVKSIDLSLDIDNVKIKDKGQFYIWTALFVLVILSILGLANYYITLLVVVIATMKINKELLVNVDYILLGTFVCFFIFIGNVSNIEGIRNIMGGYLNSGNATYTSSVILSQFISNVPSAIFLASFTTHWKELLMGVNIGGMGTLIASLASLISYKIYTNENPGEGKKYLVKFNVYNFVSLGVFFIMGILILNTYSFM
jgi:Na+/H+ antiporter NhaD/arsenite permease-like protein